MSHIKTVKSFRVSPPDATTEDLEEVWQDQGRGSNQEGPRKRTLDVEKRRRTVTVTGQNNGIAGLVLNKSRARSPVLQFSPSRRANSACLVSRI